MRKIVLALALVVAAPLSLGAQADTPGDVPAPREGALHAVPLYGALVRPYDAPKNPYAPGHRGVDVAAPIGAPVRASAPGLVTFAGNVAGNLSVTVDHGDGLKTSYSYLGSITAQRGQQVARGDVVGVVGRGHPDVDFPPHVHLSARRDDVYFDPLELYVGNSYADLVALTG
jgi:murein DD-endopeptidase MepM/ murein hydrolase activator NlpD